MRVEIARCPNCSGALKLESGVDIIECEYCGTRARVRRRTRLFLQSVRADDLPFADQVLSPAWKVFSVLAPTVVVIVVIASVFLTQRCEQSDRAAARDNATPVMGAALPVPDDSGRFVVLTHDAKLLGRLALHDKTGARLWRSPAIEATETLARGRAFATAKNIVFSSDDGFVHVFATDDGAASKLDAKIVADAGCQTDDGGLVLVLRDKSFYHLGRGPLASRPEPCAELPVLRWNTVAPRSVRMPGEDAALDAIIRSFNRELYAAGDFGFIAVGLRAEDPPVPMAAVVGPGGDVRWKHELVGGKRNLAPKYHGAAGDRAIISFGVDLDSVVIALGLADGKPSWQQATKTPFFHLSVGRDAIYLTRETTLHVIDPSAGADRFTLPRR